MIEALYLHIPFCVSRCAYCDFATNACDDDERMDAYVDALSLQLRRASKAGLLGNVKTIYIGGGTPTHLGARRLNSLVYLISLSVNLESVIEFTCEANPESLDERMVKDLFALGVNRMSIGAQSFDDAVLEGYGRIHDSAAIDAAVDAAKTRLENFSLDLICGGPGQDMDSWVTSVERAVELGAKHVSVYPLMLEEGAPMTALVDAGELTVAGEDEQAEMMLSAERVLTDAGMHRYEVASYAYPGFESKHNTAYWTGVEYLGLGAGAASMLSAESFEAACDAGIFDEVSVGAGFHLARGPHEMRPLRKREDCRYRIYTAPDDLAFSESLGTPEVEVELLTPYEAAVEDLMLGMRRSCGVSVSAVEAVNGASAVFADLECNGLVTRQKNRPSGEKDETADDRFAPTPRGWLMGNEVYGAIWSLAEGQRHP